VAGGSWRRFVRRIIGRSVKLSAAAAVACAAVAALLLSGCAVSEKASSDLLAESISKALDKEDAQRPVGSVACTPHIQKVEYSEGIVNLHCVIQFKNGTSYSTPATIEDRSFQVEGENYTFNTPEPEQATNPTTADILKTPLPVPATSVPATSSQSFFYSRNMQSAIAALKSHAGSGQLILSMALYPGEVQAVIGANGHARLVTVPTSGSVTVGPVGTFENSASGITVAELEANVPERLLHSIAARAGGVPASQIGRFVLAFLPHEVSGWDIYTSGGEKRFQAELNGEALKVLSSRAQG
jgi:hypothetical protein